MESILKVLNIYILNKFRGNIKINYGKELIILDSFCIAIFLPSLGVRDEVVYFIVIP